MLNNKIINKNDNKNSQKCNNYTVVVHPLAFCSCLLLAGWHVLSFGRPRWIWWWRRWEWVFQQHRWHDGDAINPRCVGVDGDVMGSVVLRWRSWIRTRCVSTMSRRSMAFRTYSDEIRCGGGFVVQRQCHNWSVGQWRGCRWLDRSVAMAWKDGYGHRIGRRRCRIMAIQRTFLRFAAISRSTTNYDQKAFVAA